MQGVTQQNYWKPETPIFHDRIDAGRKLGQKLLEMYGEDALQDAILLGFARGGVVIAEGIRQELQHINLALDILVCRKIGLPSNKEYGIGALDESFEPHYLKYLLEKFEVDVFSPEMKAQIESEQNELKRRQELYRRGQPLPLLEGKKVFIIDDSIVGGATAIAGFKSLEKLMSNAKASVIFAVPVASTKALNNVKEHTGLEEENFCIYEIPKIPPGRNWDSDDFYVDFPDVSDEEVIRIRDNE